MLVLRGLLAAGMIGCGIVVMARMVESFHAGIAILPGLVLGAAMIALGVHRLSLIARVRGIT
jgi:hypothetical protein